MDGGFGYLYDNSPEGYVLNDTGVMGETTESDTDALFRNLEDELRVLISRYGMQTSDLEQLFLVVHQMFAIMDTNQELLSIAHTDKQELENLWMQAKDELKLTKQRKANLQSDLEDEQMKNEFERIEYEKEKALMKTKLKQADEYKQIIEQDLFKVKEKMSQNDKKRTEILELYKKQLDAGKTATLKRKSNTNTLKRRAVHSSPKSVIRQEPLDAVARSLGGLPCASVKSDNILKSTDLLIPVTFLHDAHDEEESRTSYHTRTCTPPPDPPQSLADELRSKLEDVTFSLKPNGREFDVGGINGSLKRNEGCGESMYEENYFVSNDEYEDEGTFEELLAVDPQMITEVAMLQKENEWWGTEQRKLEMEKRKLREEKDAFERQSTQLQVELKRLQANHRDLQEKLSNVMKERDEILDNYLEQPFDEYCITRKELHKLLMDQQMTKFELEKAWEEKRKLLRELESKRSIFERFRLSLRKMFGTSPTYGEVTEKPKQAAVVPLPPTPIVRDISSNLESGDFMVKKGWLMSHETLVKECELPHWMGQITLKGVETERVECSAISRIFQSPMRIRSPSLKSKIYSPQHQVAVSSNMQQLHAEVWVGAVEGSYVRIEIIDVIARPPKVRQRFLMKPKTSHIVSMASIPGRVEASSDFTDTVNLSQETEWIEKSFNISNRYSSSYLGPCLTTRGKGHRLSVPMEWPTVDSNHNLSSTSDPGPLNDSGTFTASTPEMTGSSRSKRTCQVRKPTRKPNSHSDSFQTADLSSSCTLITIDEDTSGGGGGGAGVGATSVAIQRPRARRVYNSFSASGVENGEDTVQQLSVDNQQEDVDSDITTSPKEKVERNDQEVAQGLKMQALRSKKRYCSLRLPPNIEGDSGNAWREDFSTGSRRGLGAGAAVGAAALYEAVEYDYDCTDGGGMRGGTQVTTGEGHSSPCMWIITEEQNLIFYPSTDPSHIPINVIKLPDRALCMQYVCGMGKLRPRVFIGHSNSKLSIYCMDEFKDNVWDVDNPDIISLPCANPNEVHGIRCIACVKNRIWVGAGLSIFFLNAEDPSTREGSIFLDGHQRKPEMIQPVGEIVVVATLSSVFYVFDAVSAMELRRFDITSIIQPLELQIPNPLDSNEDKLPSNFSVPTNIKTMVADSDFLYLGTSTGKVVSVPILSLTQPPERNLECNKNKAGEKRDLHTHSLPHAAVALHAQMEGRVKTLLYLNLPRLKLMKMKEAADMMHYHSMPNLASPCGGRIPFSPPILSFRSLVISIGKGHIEYIGNGEFLEKADSSEAHRERHEAFQLLVWGHKSTVS